MLFRKSSSALALFVLLASPLLAQMGGMGSGMSGQAMGMLVVADDGSLLQTTMTGSMMGGGTPSGALVNISNSGVKRWEVSFSAGWPMMPVTKGSLVLVPLIVGGWMGEPGYTGTATLVALNLSTGLQAWSKTFTADMINGVQFAPDGSRLYVSLVDLASGSGMGTGSMGQGDGAGMGMSGTTTIVALDPAGNTLWTYTGGGTGSALKVRP